MSDKDDKDGKDGKKNAAVEAALNGIDALIVAELEALGPGKYMRVGKLAAHGRGLAEMYARRVSSAVEMGSANIHVVEDLVPAPEEAVRPAVPPGFVGVMPAQYDVVGGDAQMNIGVGRPIARGNDQADLYREIIMMVQRTLEAQTEAQRPKPPVEMPITSRIAELTYLREQLVQLHRPTDVIDKRIDALLSKAMSDTEEKTNVPVSVDDTALVPPFVPRRYPPRADLQEQDADHRRAALDQRDGSDGEADGAGLQEEVVHEDGGSPDRVASRA